MNSFLFLESGLHDLGVELVPSKRFLVDSSALQMQAYFVLCCSTVWQASCTHHVQVCKALQLASELPTFSARFQWFPWNPHLLDQWSTCLSISLGTSSQAWMLFASLWAAPPDHVYPSRGFSSNMVNRVKPVHASDGSRSSSMFQ